MQGYTLHYDPASLERLIKYLEPTQVFEEDLSSDWILGFETAKSQAFRRLVLALDQDQVLKETPYAHLIAVMKGTRI